MTLSTEALLVVSLLMAVFAAVSTIGTSLFLGAGFERLRSGFENIKRQTAFFSDAIYKLDGRVTDLEKQGSYFFESINALEQDAQGRSEPSAALPDEHLDQIVEEEKLIVTNRDDAMLSATDGLLDSQGFHTGLTTNPLAGGESTQSKYMH